MPMPSRLNLLNAAMIATLLCAAAWVMSSGFAIDATSLAVWLPPAP